MVQPARSAVAEQHTPPWQPPDAQDALEVQGVPGLREVRGEGEAGREGELAGVLEAEAPRGRELEGVLEAEAPPRGRAVAATPGELETVPEIEPVFETVKVDVPLPPLGLRVRLGDAEVVAVALPVPAAALREGVPAGHGEPVWLAV